MNDINSNIDDFKLQIESINSNKLCEIIVSFRYLGVLKEQAMLSMIELAKRRMAGDSFIFEDHIQNLLRDLPIFKTDIKQSMSIPGISNFAEMLKKTMLK